MSEQISNSGCRVAISSNGADELFAGYYDHYSFWLRKWEAVQITQNLLLIGRIAGKYVQNPILQSPDVFL